MLLNGNIIRSSAQTINGGVLRLNGITSLRGVTSVTKSDGPTKKTDENYKPPVKFTRSAAYLDYKATDNFYGGDRRDLPESHNYVLFASFMTGLTYMFWLRDDSFENDGGKNLFKPLHETYPEIGIPMIKAAIVENRRQGLNTHKLETKLAELLKESDKKGQKQRKLVEN